MKRIIALLCIFAACLEASAQITLLGKKPEDQFLTNFWTQNNNAGLAIVGIGENAGTNQFDINVIPIVWGSGLTVATNGTAPHRWYYVTAPGGGGGGGDDPAAIHDNQSGEIAGIASKATPIASDLLIIESAPDSNAKRSITIGSLESALEGVMDLPDLQGVLTDGQVPNDITINFAASSGTANAGDNATAFFPSGQIERARGGTGADTATYGTGLLGSDGSNNTIDVDTEAELETALGGLNIIRSTEIDSAAEFFGLMPDFTGSGLAVRQGSPTLTGTTGLDIVRATSYHATNGYTAGTAWTITTNSNNGAIEIFSSTTGRKITLYPVSAALHYGLSIDSATLRIDLGDPTAAFMVGPGSGTNNSSTNWLNLDGNAMRVGPGIVLSNTPSGLLLNPGGGGLVGAAAVGNGLKIDGGFLKGDFSTSEGGTNNSPHAFGGLKILNTYTVPLVHLTANTIVIDPTKTNAYRITATNTVNISFAGLPADTNLQTSPVFVYITNTASATTNGINVTWPSAESYWVGEISPQLPPLKTTVLRFWYAAGRMFGDYDQPHLMANEFETGLLTASSSVTNYIADFTREGAVAVLSNDLFLFTTNRPATEYAFSRSYQLYVRATGANRNIQLHSSMNPPKDDENYTYVLTNGTAAMISLISHGPSETNTSFALRRFK